MPPQAFPLDASTPRADAWHVVGFGGFGGFGSGWLTGVGEGVGLAGGFGVADGPPAPPFVVGFVVGLAARTGPDVVAGAGVDGGASEGTGDGGGSTVGLGDGSGAAGVGCEPGSVDGCGPGPPGREDGCGFAGVVGFGLPG